LIFIGFLLVVIGPLLALLGSPASESLKSLYSFTNTVKGMMKLANLVIAKLFDQVTRQILKKYLWFMNHLVKQGRLPLQDKL
jgi:phage-related holin